MKHFLILCIVLLIISSCSSDIQEKENWDKDTPSFDILKKPILEKNTLRQDDVYQSFIWMTKQEAVEYAQENNIKFRIGKEDNKAYMLTMDYVVWRATATLKDGRVIGLNIEWRKSILE